VELYEQIRREYEHGAGTVRGVSRKLGGGKRPCATLEPEACAAHGDIQHKARIRFFRLNSAVPAWLNRARSISAESRLPWAGQTSCSR